MAGEDHTREAATLIEDMALSQQMAAAAAALGIFPPPVGSPVAEFAKLRAELVIGLIGAWTHGKPGEYDPDVIPGLAFSVVDMVLARTHGKDEGT